jgi:two-component system, NtrC family, response regulator GlrR
LEATVAEHDDPVAAAACSGAAYAFDDAFTRLNLIGTSGAFCAARQRLQRLAPCLAPVLVQGETGTGKELFARAVHYLSDRRSGPFIPVNCGALPDSLVESELFGHVRGAFTDAREAREGLVAQARGGTLFLDELETLSVRGQVALLRFLQDQEYRPVGGRVVRDADVRVVGSTNASLEHMAAHGQFRQDLYFRLNVLVLDLPPLRDREDDVVLLANAFIERLARQYGKPVPRVHPRALSFLRSHHWPGNVRELENLVHREFLLCDGADLDPTPGVATESARPRTVPGFDTEAEGALTAFTFRAAKARAVEAFERAYLAELLARACGNVSLAARLAGKERSRLSKLIRKHGLRGAGSGA